MPVLQKKLSAKVSFVLLLCAALYITRLEVYFYFEQQETLPRYVGQSVTLEGTVADDPDPRATDVHVVVAVQNINGAPASGKLLALTPPDTQVAYGDRIVVRGSLEAPQTFLTDTGRVFDYPNYLRLQGISLVMPRASVTESSAGGLSLYRALYALKHALQNSLNISLPPVDAGLMQGILLGNRRGLSQDLTQGLVAAGLIHIVILAGYVLSLIADILSRVAQKLLPRRAALVSVALFLVLFVVMTGAAATTVRAAVMALIALLARFVRRPGSALRALLFAALGMALYNPLLPLYDESFIISVAATLGLVACGGLVQERLRFITEKFELRGIAASSLTVQLAALPALLYYTGTVSLISVPANLAVLPVLPLIMLAGCLSAFMGLIPVVGDFLALMPALVAHVLLGWILLVVSVVEKIPFAALTAPPFAGWIAALLYVPLILAASYLARRSVPQQLPS